MPTSSTISNTLAFLIWTRQSFFVARAMSMSLMARIRIPDTIPALAPGDASFTAVTTFPIPVVSIVSPCAPVMDFVTFTRMVRFCGLAPPAPGLPCAGERPALGADRRRFFPGCCWGAPFVAFGGLAIAAPATPPAGTAAAVALAGVSVS
jgi:hypothetical protein